MTCQPFSIPRFSASKNIPQITFFQTLELTIACLDLIILIVHATARNPMQNLREILKLTYVKILNSNTLSVFP